MKIQRNKAWHEKAIVNIPRYSSTVSLHCVLNVYFLTYSNEFLFLAGKEVAVADIQEVFFV